MALTKEQFQKLRDKGLSVEQIAKFEGSKPPQKTSGFWDQVRQARSIMNPTEEQLSQSLSTGEMANRKLLMEKSRPMRLVGQLGLGATEGLTGGINKVIPPDLRQDQATIGKPELSMRATGNVLGSLGLYGGIKNVVNKGVQGIGLAKDALRAGATGFGFGAAQTPEQGFLDWRQRVKTGGAGAALNVALEVAPKLINLAGKKSGFKIAQKIDKIFTKKGEGLSKEYDDMFSKIKGQTTDVDDIVSTIDDITTTHGEAPNVAKLKRIKKSLTKQGKISAKELQDLKQDVKRIIPSSVLEGKSRPNAIQYKQSQLYWKINEKLEQIGGSEYSGLTQEYKNYIQARKSMGKFIYEGGKPSDYGMRRSLSYAKRKDLEKFGKKINEDILGDFLAWRRGQNTKQALGKMAPYALMGGGGLYGLSKMLKGGGE